MISRAHFFVPCLCSIRRACRPPFLTLGFTTLSHSSSRLNRRANPPHPLHLHAHVLADLERQSGAATNATKTKTFDAKFTNASAALYAASCSPPLTRISSTRWSSLSLWPAAT